MLRLTALGLATAVVVGSVSSASAQQDGGLMALHDVRREGRVVCIVEHWHYGGSQSMPSRAAAQKAAIADWSSFTAFEYGDHWGRWSLAKDKSMECSQSGNSWNCGANARPCKTATSESRRRARR